MNIKKIIISSLFVLSFGLFTGVANAGCGKVVVASQNWASAELMAEVDKVILEKGFGCEVELIPGAITTIAKAIIIVWLTPAKIVGRDRGI